MLPEDVHRIPLPTPFQIGDVNTYLLRGSPLTLVDAGPRMEETEARLEAGLAALGVAVEDLELLVLTHQHDDHVGLAAELARRSGAEVAGTARLARYLGDLDASMEADDDYAVALMRRHGVSPGTIATLGEVSRAYRRFAGAAVPVGRILEPTAASWRRAGAGGRSPSGPATRPRTPCSPRTGCCSPVTTCWRRSPPTRSRTCPWACPTPSPSRRRPTARARC